MAEDLLDEILSNKISFDTFLFFHKKLSPHYKIKIIKHYLNNKWMPTKKQFKKIIKHCPYSITDLLEYNYYLDQEEVNMIFHWSNLNEDIQRDFYFYETDRFITLVFYVINNNLYLPKHVFNIIITQWKYFEKLDNINNLVKYYIEHQTKDQFIGLYGFFTCYINDYEKNIRKFFDKYVEIIDKNILLNDFIYDIQKEVDTLTVSSSDIHRLKERLEYFKEKCKSKKRS